MLLALLACACEKKENQPVEKTAVCHELLQQLTFDMDTHHSKERMLIMKRQHSMVKTKLMSVTMD